MSISSASVNRDIHSHAPWRADPLELLDAAIAGLAGEQRDGQRELASAVSRAIGDGHHLVAEAPTGSGKSLAYLAPAVASGLTVVVATSTIALQGQLMQKDLPALARHGALPFTFALLKGRSNYLCRAKLRAAAEPDALFERPVAAGFSKHLEHFNELARSSPTGDRAALVEPITDSSWAAVSCTSLECPGRTNCADGAECFAELARGRAQTVSVLVVNHALYCMDIAAGGNVLPEHDLVVIDEAHAFAENATNAFGADLAPESLTRIAGMLGKAGADAAAVTALTDSATALAKLVVDRAGRVDVGRDDQLQSALHATAERLAGASARPGRADDEGAKRTARLSAARLEVLRRLAAPADTDVVWIERIRNSDRIRIAPVAVGDALAALLLERRPVVAVSATLGGDPPFNEFAAATGFVASAPLGTWGDRDDDDVLEPATGRGYEAVRVSSSFDWKRQGLLYVGSDLPDPGRANEAWLERAGDRLCTLVTAAGGRALVLCTSNANVRRFSDLLRARTEHEVISQGDGEVSRLIAAFLESETSVLVGTRSFWAGIDAPGVACVLVVIDRIPFPAPNEPLHAARRERAERLGRNAFAAVDLPRAALVLAQGAGRLLRSRTDRGVVAVLDPRLATREYRTTLLSGVPPLRRSIDVEAACAFLTEAASGGAEPAAISE
jgi:ATP-dependent DNA helicase DinG